MTDPAIANRGDSARPPGPPARRGLRPVRGGLGAGGRPRIEDRLIEVAGSERPELLHALLQVERSSAGRR